VAAWIFKPRAVAGLLLLAACWSGACAPRAVEPIRFDTTGLRPAADYGDLAFVLKRSVTAKGMLDRRRLTDCIDRLDAQLALLAVMGPTASPGLLVSKEDVLAYWYNARAAWAIKLASMLEGDKPPRPELLEDRTFALDGRTMTLRDIDAVLAGQDDWRVLVAAPDVRFSRAGLPQEPFSASDLRSRIVSRVNEVLGDPKRVVLDAGRKEIHIPPVLWRFRGRITEEHRKAYGAEAATFTSALLPHARGRALKRLQDAVGYVAAPGPVYGEIAAK
jgi:hypothetical protein